MVVLVTAFNYKDTYSLSTPSIKVSKVVLENNNVLCLQINITSIDYIDSLIIEPKNSIINTDKRVYIFDSKTKRATVFYYFYEEEMTNKLEFNIKIKKDDSKSEYERVLKLTEI